AVRGYSRTKQVSSFAATFPTDGTPEDQRYFVLVLMDEPHATAKTFGFVTADSRKVSPGFLFAALPGTKANGAAFAAQAAQAGAAAVIAEQDLGLGVP